jgi:hypothetical protein
MTQTVAHPGVEVGNAVVLTAVLLHLLPVAYYRPAIFDFAKRVGAFDSVNRHHVPVDNCSKHTERIIYQQPRCGGRTDNIANQVNQG